MKDKSKNYILSIYTLKYTFVGTREEISKELDNWEFNIETEVENDDYFLSSVDDIFNKLYFWDVFSMKIVPNLEFN